MVTSFCANPGISMLGFLFLKPYVMFEINQSVVCVNDKPIDIQGFYIKPPVKKGRTYTIKGINDDLVDVGFKKTDSNDIWWVAASRFLPIDHTEGIEKMINEALVKKEDLILN